jgi:putative SOS response-associated peptidase YedK
MCGRFTIAVEPLELQEEFNIPEMPADWIIRYNVAPTQLIPVITNSSERKIEFYKWGLVRGWAKDASIGVRMINARAETIIEKPSFRKPFQKQRCLILADGFYEWKKGLHGRGPSEPYRFQKKDGKPFAFAGLWDAWHSPAGEEIRTCTIITCHANTVVAPVHERMPVILEKANYWKWLDETNENDLLNLLVPYSSAFV